MGWASAGPEIFNPMAELVVNLNLDDGYVTEILSELIRLLKAGDWDTEDESLNEFRYHPEVVDAFAEHGIRLPGKRCPHCDEILEDCDD